MPIVAASSEPPVVLLRAPAGEATVTAGSGWVVLTVEELRGIITDTTMQAVQACLSVLVDHHGDATDSGVT
jgi:hypothetical protein